MKAVFLDIETTGLDPDMQSALEIACAIVDLHTMECIKEYSSFIRCSETEWLLHSDPKAIAVNGITFEDVKDAPQPATICEDLTELFLSYEIERHLSLIICQNPSFDRAFFAQIMPVETQIELALPYHWLDLASMHWIKVLAPTLPKEGAMVHSLSKDNIAQFFSLPPEEKPHRALNGVRHLIECYKKLLAYK